MPNIEIDFQKYVPIVGIFYAYCSILKSHNYINDFKFEKNNEEMYVIKVIKNPEDLSKTLDQLVN